jgi:hypothetical protein
LGIKKEELKVAANKAVQAQEVLNAEVSRVAQQQFLKEMGISGVKVNLDGRIDYDGMQGDNIFSPLLFLIAY